MMTLCSVGAMAQNDKGMMNHEAVNNLVVAERIYRTSHRNEEQKRLYFPDAQTHTSWQIII